MDPNIFADEAVSPAQRRFAASRWKSFVNLCLLLWLYVLLDLMAAELAFRRGFDPVALLLLPAECTIAFIVFRRVAGIRDLTMRAYGTGIIGMFRGPLVPSGQEDPERSRKAALETASLRAFLWDGICGRGWVLPLESERSAIDGSTVREGELDLATAAALRAARVSARRTQEWLAHRSGVSVRTISRAETSGRISFVNYRALCESLGMESPIPVAQPITGHPYSWVVVLLWIRRFLAGMTFGPTDPDTAPDPWVRIGNGVSVVVVAGMGFHFLILSAASALSSHEPMLQDPHNQAVVMGILGGFLWGTLFPVLLCGLFSILVADGIWRATGSRNSGCLAMIVVLLALVPWPIRHGETQFIRVFDRFDVARVAEKIVDGRLVAAAHGDANLLARSRFFERNKIEFGLMGMNPPLWMVDETAWEQHSSASKKDDGSSFLGGGHVSFPTAKSSRDLSSTRDYP